MVFLTGNDFGELSCFQSTWIDLQAHHEEIGEARNTGSEIRLSYALACGIPMVVYPDAFFASDFHSE